MKNIYLIIIIHIFSFVSGVAQNCYLGITTNPDNTIWNNPPYNTLYKQNTGPNKFDWRQPIYNFSLPFSATYNNIPSHQLLSPFFFGAEAPYLSSIIAFPDNGGVLNDFNPEDGWELIRKDFGFKADGTTNTSESLAGPYLILYNKYTGTLRVFGWLASANGDFPTINVRLGLKHIAGQNDVTGLFSYYNQLALPMDKPSTIIHATTPASFPPVPEWPFFADFKVAYDPCTCNIASNLIVSMEKVQQMDVTLYGRVLATSTPVNLVPDSLLSTTKSKYNFKNYLTSVYDQENSDKSITAGMLTYGTINQMISDYKLSAEATSSSDFFKEGFDILGKALSVASIFGPEGKEGLKRGLEAASTLSDFLSGRFGSETTTLPSVIQGEMSLTGHVVNKSDQHYDYPIANPGSLGSDNAPECCSANPYYPMYNEVLGVFALTETPIANVRVHPFIFANPHNPGISHATFEVIVQTPKYIFNPATRINLANSRLYTSIELEIGGNINGGKDIFRRYTTDGKTVYSSPSVPIESQQLLSMGYDIDYRFMGTGKLKLSVMLDLEFYDLNKKGIPNRSVMVLTYPLKISSITDYNLTLGNSIASGFLTIGQTNFTSSQVISSWYDITITGNLTASTGTTVTINAGGNIIVQPGVSVGAGVILKSGAYPISIDQALRPQSTAQVSSFCSSSNYPQKRLQQQEFNQMKHY